MMHRRDIGQFRIYSLSGEPIESFAVKLNCIEGVTITRVGKTEELHAQTMRMKRVSFSLVR